MDNNEVALAIDFLRKRAIPTNKCGNEKLKNSLAVVPLFEVEGVINMLSDKSFLKFYIKMQNLGLDEFK